jgi:hypothetical protein
MKKPVTVEIVREEKGFYWQQASKLEDARLPLQSSISPEWQR